MRRFAVSVAVVAAAAGPLGAQSPAPLDDATVKQILVDRIDRDHQGVGIVVGLTGPGGRRIIGYGRRDVGDDAPLAAHTMFEIGSISKVFTSLVLADMVTRHEIALTDPIEKFLPSGVTAPTRNGKSITLEDLSTHTSGLPRLPTNLKPTDPTNPYADYSVDQLYQFLSTYTLTRDIGSQYEYSNLGGGLLGHVLGRRAGLSYEALVRERVTGPLAMPNTSIALTPDQRARLAVGHDAQLKAVPNWDLPTLAGAGALRSCADDMLTFVEAAMGAKPTPLASAFGTMLATRRPTGNPNMEVALAWHIVSRNGRDIVWHNGGTGGYRSFIGYDKAAGVGVVVLSNTSTAMGVDDIGLHLLDRRNPLLPPPVKHTEVTANAKLFDGYVGKYQLTPNFAIAITREGDRLFLQATNQPRVELFAEGDRDYFLKVVDASITFIVGDDGKVTALVLHQNGANVTGTRAE
jgi:CubicO group peptidase (beta-lactamase class C family)